MTRMLRDMSLDLAGRLTEAGSARATEMGIASVVIVVDRGGRLVLADRMDGATHCAFPLALAKAETAAATLATRVWFSTTQPGRPDWGMSTALGSRLICMPGGPWSSWPARSSARSASAVARPNRTSPAPKPPWQCRPQMSEFSGRVAFVTGGESGIGQALVKALHQAGVFVAVADISGALPIDMSDAGQVEVALADVMTAHRRLDMVFSNAAMLVGGPVERLAIADFDRTIAVNLRGAFLVARFAIPHLRRSGRSGIWRRRGRRRSAPC